MRFPDAARGVKKIFAAEILALFGRLSIIAAIIFLAVAIISGGASAEGLASGTADVDQVISGIAASSVGGLLGAVICFIAASVLSIIAYILRIVGVVQARKNEDVFGTALAFIIIGLVCTALYVIFEGISPVVSSFANTVADLMEVLVTVFVVSGIVKLSDQLNNGEVAKKGIFIIKLIVFINAFALIGNLIMSFMGGVNDSSDLASVIIAIVVSVLSIVEYILYLSFLVKAKKMLEK